MITVKKLTSFILLIIILFSFATFITYAERSYKITDYQAQVKILENGDIQVSEIFEYDFDGDFNGIIRTIRIKGSDGFEYFKASEYFPGDKELEYTQSLAADMVTYKIYDKSSNERKLFLLEYQLKNVATLYNDTAEFYWKFFDKSNTSPIGHIKIEIELPSAKVSAEELKVFGHGQLDGKVSIREDGKIVYEVFRLSSREMVEARILFPTSMIPHSSKIINQNKFSEIMEEESEGIEALKEEVTEASSSKDYFPLDEGRRWEYQVYVKKKDPWYLSGPIKISAKQVCTIFPQREIKGKKVTPMQIEQIQRGSVYTRFLFYVKDQNSIYEFASQKPEDVEPKIFHDYIIKYPIQVGNSWQETETSSLEPRISVPIKSTIESIDEVVTVPAGTFKECLKIKSIGFAEKVFGEEEQKWPPPPKEYVKIERERYYWFAPGVGIIKGIFKEKKANSPVTPTSEISHFLEIVMQLETFK
jgi:hypothetical protein